MKTINYDNAIKLIDNCIDKLARENKLDPKTNKEGLKDMMHVFCNHCHKYSHIPYKDWLRHVEDNAVVKCPLCNSDSLDFHPGKM